MNSTRTDSPTRPADSKRAVTRWPMAVPARLTWKDQRGATRFASAVTRDVSEFGVYVEFGSPVSIPLYRLVQLQLERDGHDADGLPVSLSQGRILSAVYRVVPPDSSGRNQGLALRLMVDPKSRMNRSARPGTVDAARATA